MKLRVPLSSPFFKFAIVSMLILAVFTPVRSYGDFVVLFEPSFRVNHAGLSFYNGNPDDIFVPPAPVVVHTSDFSHSTQAWNFEQLVAPWIPDGGDIPLTRGLFVVARLDPDTFDIEGGVPVRGQNYDFVHAPWSTVSTTTLHTTFSLSPLGNPTTPSGIYNFFFL